MMFYEYFQQYIFEIRKYTRFLQKVFTLLPLHRFDTTVTRIAISTINEKMDVYKFCRIYTLQLPHI